ncbi:MAG TPA: MBOAT family O-acyltransferase [Kofleriaceae bacterium]|jgi:D-alanyl-lipoteichoic acid acyltransferase DltB (MBOAT superfamily)
MLFSSPDYPVFLIAVFFLYALARWTKLPTLPYLRHLGEKPARFVLMLLLGDVVFVLVSKNPDALWDPVGGVLLRLATTSHFAISGADILHWVVGGALFIGAIVLGRTRGAWIASERGQSMIARGLVTMIVAVGLTVLVSHHNGVLAETTATIATYGHLLVLFVLGIALGLSMEETQRPLGRVVILFVASTLFYHAWAAAMPGPYKYLLALLLGTIVLDYYLGIWIENAEDPWTRKALLIVSLCSNLGILFFFKYYDFFMFDVGSHIPGFDTVAHGWIGIKSSPLHLILPAGISFHTFQSLSYTIDVYRRELKATRSVVTFATFVLFFPQLVAGPIVRAQDLLPQLENPPALDMERATVGLYRILIGLFKKIAIADTLALAIVDRVFEAPATFSSLEVAVGVAAYAFQIFCDFSAYSDIAIGSAQVLGFTMPENFRTPYRSANLQEFWRRWHISLSTWLRDYLYVTLGGNRKGPAMTYVNLTLTMLLGGLWHGASWAFIVWGALHGLGLAVTRYFQRATAGKRDEAWSLLGGCAVFAIAGVAFLQYAHPTSSIWWQLALGWVFVMPLWAVITAWLGRDPNKEAPPPQDIPPFETALDTPRALVVEILRIAMVLAGIGFFLSLRFCEEWTWLPLLALPWALGLAGDIVERRGGDLGPPGVRMRVLVWWIDLHMTWSQLFAVLGRALSTVLTFAYVCLAWIFFRAPTFNDALAVLRQLAKVELDHANLIPLVTVPLAAGFATHFWADGAYRWARTRFLEMPAPAQGLVLAGCALLLRELAHPTIVPFIYFQF